MASAVPIADPADAKGAPVVAGATEDTGIPRIRADRREASLGCRLDVRVLTVPGRVVSPLDVGAITRIVVREVRGNK